MNIEKIIKEVLRRYANKSIQFENFTNTLEAGFVNQFNKLNKDKLYDELKKTKQKRQFGFMKKRPLKQEVVLFFELLEKGFLMHLSPVSSEIKIFTLDGKDFDFFPQHTLNFIEKIHNKSNSTFSLLCRNDKSAQKMMTSLQYSLYLTIEILTNRMNPLLTTKLPSPTKGEFYTLQKTIKSIAKLNGKSNPDSQLLHPKKAASKSSSYQTQRQALARLKSVETQTDSYITCSEKSSFQQNIALLKLKVANLKAEKSNFQQEIASLKLKVANLEDELKK